MNLRTGTALALLAVLLGLVACGKQEDEADVATFEEAPCPFELPASVVQGQDVLCGYVTVPEVHAQPDGETIRLAVAVLKSMGGDPASDPLVIESGGPGNSTLAGVPSLLGQADLRAERDIVLVEQRGTLYSRPYLPCTEVLGVVLEMFGQSFSDAQASTRMTEALSACRDRLVAGGVNLSAYNSRENAADIAMVLTALGYDKFNLYGISYSTTLAQHVMRDYPNRLRSVILDSVAPLSVNGLVQMPNSVDRAFRLLFERCAADTGCNRHFPDLETVFFDLVEELDRNPVTVPFGGPGEMEMLVTGQRLIWRLFINLQSGPIAMLPASLYAMADGDYSLMANLGTPFLPEGLLASGMGNSVLCAEETDYSDADWDLEGVYPQVGALIRDGFDIRDECAVWNVAPLNDEAGAPVVSDIPTLILSGEFDPNTPPGGGDLVAETLSHSYVYTFPGITHGALSDSPCAQSITLEFLDDPTRAPDAGCIADMRLQFVVPTDDVRLEPFSDAAYGLRGLLPAGWVNAGPGTFVRLNSKGELAFLLMARFPKLPLDQHLTPRLQRLGVSELPERGGRYATAALTWDLYTLEGTLPSLGGTARVDLALAETDAGIYLVALYATPEEYAALHAAVFVPAVEALAPLKKSPNLGRQTCGVGL
jgi:pimeloyl-ACP methyl ester carboxylesterase